MNTKYFIPQQVPEFILQKYPAFVEFITAYYDWFEKTQVDLNKQVVDIDESLEQFIQYFRNELDIDGILYNNDNRLFLRRIKDLYKAKGSEASFDLFFKLVFKKPASVFYPWDMTLKVSDGKWIQESSILIKLSALSPDDLIGKNVFIQFGGASYEVFLDRYLVVKGHSNVFEFFIDRRWHHLIPGDAAVIYNDVSIGITLYTTISTKILKKGKGFKVGEIYNIEDGGGTGSLYKIVKVDKSGGILKGELIKFGVGYQNRKFTSFVIPYSIRAFLCEDFLLTELLEYLNQEDNGRIRTEGLLSYEDFVLTEVIDTTEYLNQENSKHIRVEGLNEGFAFQEPICADQSEYQAVIEIEVGAVSKYPGYFKNNDGLLDDEMYIQDSFYYQAYSYVVQVDEQLKSYKNLLTQVLHPSGLALFGEYSLENNLFTATDVEDNTVYNAKRAFTEVQYVDDRIIKHFTKSLSNDISADAKLNVLGALEDTPLSSEAGDLFSVAKSVECLSYIGSENGDYLARENNDVFVTQKTSNCMSFLLQENGSYILTDDDKYRLENNVGFTPCLIQEHILDSGYVFDNNAYWDVSYHYDAELYIDSGLARYF